MLDQLRNKRAIALGAIVAASMSGIAFGARSLDSPTRGSGSVEKPKGPVWSADWAYRPASVAEMRSKSELVARVRVVRIEQGAPLTTPGAPDVEPAPTQRVTLAVERASRPAGELTLFKTGTQERWIEDDPPYQVGRAYVMFLSRRDDGLYIPVAQDGRIDVSSTTPTVPIDGAVRREVAAQPAVIEVAP